MTLGLFDNAEPSERQVHSLVLARGWDMKTIRGLSLTRPWPFAFVNSSPKAPAKRIENRSWSVPDSIRGQYLALHAAQSWSESDREFIADTMGLSVPRKFNSPHSEIFAVCRVIGVTETINDAAIPPEQRVWFFGPYGWLLDDFVELLKPVPCVGARSVWKFDDKPEVLQALRESYRESIQLRAA